MRAALLSCFHPYRGGIAQFNECLLNELGKENIVKAFNFKRQYPEFLFPGKTQYVAGGAVSALADSSAVLDTANPFSYASAARAIREWEPDILILRYWMSYFAPSLGYVARHVGKNCKVVAILDNVIPHERRFFDTPLTKYFLGGCDGFITLCGAVREDLLKMKPDARCKVIPHPLYSHFGEKRPRGKALEELSLPDDGKKTLLFFGLIREYKGLDILLEAFGKLGEDYRLIIAGEPYGSFGKYEKIMERLPNRDAIHLFPDYIPDSRVAVFFSAADAVVLPYRSATQSGISSVAYHFEVPMIVTDTGGLKETVGERGTGLVAPVCTPEAVEREIRRYFGDPGLRDRCVSAIRSEKDRLSWGSFCKELTDFAVQL